MKKIKLYSIVCCALVLLTLSLNGCKNTDPVIVDETGYAGTYIGYHYLADSTSLRVITGTTSDSAFIYKDTLVVTHGSDTTDGKVYAKSSLLNGSSIEVDLSTNNVTPVYLGNINILSTTLKDSKFTSGTASWNGAKTVLTTHLVAAVTYTLGSTDIPIAPVNINGSFVKQ